MSGSLVLECYRGEKAKVLILISDGLDFGQ